MIRSEYKASKSMPMLILKAIFAGLLLEIIFGLFLLHGELLIIGLIICVLVIPALLIVYVLSNMLVVRVTDFEVQFIRFGKPIESIPFENHEFASYTYTLRFRLEYSNSPKYLRVIDASGQVKEYSCCSLSQKDFERLTGEVISISEAYQRRKHEEEVIENAISEIKSAPIGEEIPGKPLPKAIFIFPKAELHAVLKRNIKMNIITTVVGVLLVALVNPGILLFLETANTELFFRQLFFALFLFGFFGIGNLVLWVQYLVQVTEIPEKISFTENELLIDDQKFHLKDIKEIRISKERDFYPNQTRFRTMKIAAAGNKKKYILGHMMMGKRCFYYEDYGKLCSSLSNFLKQNERPDVLEND